MVLGGRIVVRNVDRIGTGAGCIVAPRAGCGCPLGCAGALHHGRFLMLHSWRRGAFVDDDSQQ
ncbi:hypothetical protein GS421_06680 [Rhodococcus hoagii]|nr:hypothetical protein [Prescottella equi]